MADTSTKPGPLGIVYSLIMTAIIIGLAYWIWQDIRPLLRPFRGDGWQFLKNLNFLLNVLAVFLLLSVGNFVFDQAGRATPVKRVIALILVVGVMLSLVRYGSFFGKEIEPQLQAFGFERPQILTQQK